MTVIIKTCTKKVGDCFSQEKEKKKKCKEGKILYKNYKQNELYIYDFIIK